MKAKFQWSKKKMKAKFVLGPMFLYLLTSMISLSSGYKAIISGYKAIIPFGPYDEIFLFSYK